MVFDDNFDDVFSDFDNLIFSDFRFTLIALFQHQWSILNQCVNLLSCVVNVFFYHTKRLFELVLRM